MDATHRLQKQRVLKRPKVDAGRLPAPRAPGCAVVDRTRAPRPGPGERPVAQGCLAVICDNPDANRKGHRAPSTIQGCPIRRQLRSNKQQSTGAIPSSRIGLIFVRLNSAELMIVTLQGSQPCSVPRIKARPLAKVRPTGIGARARSNTARQANRAARC